MVNQNSLQAYPYPIAIQDIVVKRLYDRKAYLNWLIFIFPSQNAGQASSDPTAL